MGRGTGHRTYRIRRGATRPPPPPAKKKRASVFTPSSKQLAQESAAAHLQGKELVVNVRWDRRRRHFLALIP